MRETFAQPPKGVRGDLLATELRAAGVEVEQRDILVEETEDGPQVHVYNVAEEDRPTIEGVLATHDPATIRQQEVQETDRRTKVRDKIAGAIGALENATKDKATWDALTAAQRQEITRQALFAMAKMARFILGRFDVPE